MTIINRIITTTPRELLPSESNHKRGERDSKCQEVSILHHTKKIKIIKQCDCGYQAKRNIWQYPMEEVYLFMPSMRERFPGCLNMHQAKMLIHFKYSSNHST